jgi:hypothetical protein
MESRSYAVISMVEKQSEIGRDEESGSFLPIAGIPT